MNNINLTKKQKQIANILITTGESDKYIANELGIAVPTVKMHLEHMRTKVCVLTGKPIKNRVQLVLELLKRTY